MNRNKQIEEMQKVIVENTAIYDSDVAQDVAEILIYKDYRKASEVALEVIAEVVSKAKAIFCPDCDYDVADIRYNLDWLEAELKKKYESEKDNA